ncbi:MAG: ATP-binding cassette domain-containing protein [Thiolinea sp.]
MLTATQLHYSYPEAGKRHVVLKDVSLSLFRGERVALVGSSGSGKSTLLNLLGGIDLPERGQIFIAEQNLSQLGEPDLTLFRRRQIGFVYQQFNLIPTLTVAENVRLPLALLGMKQAEQEKRLQHWLEAVDLGGRGSAFPDQLSGGEQQRCRLRVPWA